MVSQLQPEQGQGLLLPGGDSSPWNIQGLSRLLQGEAGKVAQDDHIPQVFGQTAQGLLQGQSVKFLLGSLGQLGYGQLPLAPRNFV